MDNLYSSDFIFHDPLEPAPIVGIKAFKDYLAALRKGTPDLNVKFEDFFIKGDKFVSIWTVTATLSAPMTLPPGEIPPAGKKVKIPGVGISRIVNGKTVELWQYYSPLDVLLAIGYTLSPPQPPKPAEKPAIKK